MYCNGRGGYRFYEQNRELSTNPAVPSIIIQMNLSKEPVSSADSIMNCFLNIVLVSEQKYKGLNATTQNLDLTVLKNLH